MCTRRAELLQAVSGGMEISMRGRYHIVVQNNRLRYELDIRRNITIIKGDSATGKTTLIQMLDSAASFGENSGIDVVCEKKCRVLGGQDWKQLIPNIHDQIVFIDEENQFIKTQEFASAIRNSDNYYVIITREDLPNLPYSVDEIYGIHTSGKYHDPKRTYNELYRIYSVQDLKGPVHPETVVVEDSHSGFDFYHAVERFFTSLLVEYSQDTYLKYNKSKLNEAYLNEKIKQAILEIMKGIDFGHKIRKRKTP